jgi:mannose-6-phosphate isomerase-like protein (cupin superfamily)
VNDANTAPRHSTHYVSVAPPAPLRKVTRLSEIRCTPTRDATGHPNDHGEDCDLIGAHVNGATDMNLGVYRMGPNEYHPRHFHSRGTEFYYVMEGSCLITVDDEIVEAAPGTAVYLPEGTVHAVRTRGGESVAILYGFDEGIAENVSVTWLE